jgi:hypothetical protein
VTALLRRTQIRRLPPPAFSTSAAQSPPRTVRSYQAR